MCKVTKTDSHIDANDEASPALKTVKVSAIEGHKPTPAYLAALKAVAAMQPGKNKK